VLRFSDTKYSHLTSANKNILVGFSHFLIRKKKNKEKSFQEFLGFSKEMEFEGGKSEYGLHNIVLGE